MQVGIHFTLFMISQDKYKNKTFYNWNAYSLGKIPEILFLGQYPILKQMTLNWQQKALTIYTKPIMIMTYEGSPVYAAYCSL